MARADQQPVETQLALAALTGALALALLPALVAAIAIAETLRARRLRWTWAALAVPPLAPAALLAAHAHRPSPSLPLAWVAATPLLTMAYGAHRDRRDRLHGGAAERALADRRGPLDVLRTPPEHPIRLADDLTLPPLAAHATIVGGSNTGKTNTAAVLLAEHVANTNAGFVILDGKGGRDLPRRAVRLAEAHGRPVSLWSINPYNDPDLDRHRRPWNPAGDGTPTEIKDRIAGAEPQTEPYYKAVASRGLLIAAQQCATEPGPTTLAALATHLDQPKTLATKIADTTDRAWLASLNDAETGALRGMATRLRTMVAGDGGPALQPGLDLRAAIAAGHLVVFTLPEGLYPELIPHVARYVIAAITSVCSAIELTGTPANALVFVDELSAFDGDQLCAGFERGRSAAVRFVVATQSLSNLETAGGPKLLHAALDNAELIVVHRQAVPEAAEALASIAGTEEGWEHTHKVSDQLAVPLGLDETGDRARRLADRFRAHPNTIKSLGLGEAIVIAHRPQFAVRRVRIRPAG